MSASNSSKICSKLGSFFTHGFLAGDELKALVEEGVDAATSHDVNVLDSVSLNCISKIEGVVQSLFGQAANSVFSVVTEETIGDRGIIDGALLRHHDEIKKFEQDLKKFGHGSKTNVFG